MVAVCLLCCCVCRLWWAWHICCVMVAREKHETLCSWSEYVALYLEYTYNSAECYHDTFTSLYYCGCTPVLHSTTTVLYWSLIVRLVPVISPSISWVRREYNTVCTGVFSVNAVSSKFQCVCDQAAKNNEYCGNIT